MDLVNHPAFANTDKSFLIYLQKTLSTLTYKSDIEVIATLMAISNEASKKKCAFHTRYASSFTRISQEPFTC